MSVFPSQSGHIIIHGTIFTCARVEIKKYLGESNRNSDIFCFLLDIKEVMRPDQISKVNPKQPDRT
jgi:hypothetical protein